MTTRITPSQIIATGANTNQLLVVTANNTVGLQNIGTVLVSGTNIVVEANGRISTSPALTTVADTFHPFLLSFN